MLGITSSSTGTPSKSTKREIKQLPSSLRDVQELAGHKSIAMTQRYIEGDSDAKRRLVNLI